MNRFFRAGLILTIIAGLLLRFAGLAHESADGHINHPDTPKQIRAAERFLKGTYYHRVGLSDYDGYPYLTSHLVEYACRIGGFVISSTSDLLGLPYKQDIPQPLTLFWITRILNALLATWAIYILYALGRNAFSRGVGLLAAVFFAFSPADIDACHYSAGDTAAAFFALVAVYFAVNIYQRGRYRDYVAAGFFTMCAFAAKYHAGMVGFSVLAAHLLRYPRARDWFTASSIKPILVLAVSGIVSLFLAIPSMFLHPVIVLQDIFNFLTHVSSSFRLPTEIQEAGSSGKFLFSLKRNLPLLAKILSPTLAIVAVAGLYRVFRRDKPLIVLYTMPLLYFMVGVSLRPLSHPVYHTLMTSLIFLIAAYLIVLGCQRRWAKPWLIPVAVFSAGYLCNLALGEAFFFRHQDTRHMAKAWTMENVPTNFNIAGTRYSFSIPHYAQTVASARGTLYVSSSINPGKPASSAFPFKQFAVENESLPRFRNPTIDLYLCSNAWIRADYNMPVYPRTPARYSNDMVFINGVDLCRTDKILNVEPETKNQRILVSEKPLTNVLVVIQNGEWPNRIDVSLGGRRKEMALASGEVAWFNVERLRAAYPPCNGERYFYRLRLSADIGPARVTLAFTDEEKGAAFFEHGLYRDAPPWLKIAAMERSHPTLAAMALIAYESGSVGDTLSAEERAALQQLVHALSEPLNEDRVFQLYGIHPDYLRALSHDETRPDIMVELRAWQQVAQILSMEKTPSTNAPGILYEPLLHWGDRAANLKSYEEALRNYWLSAQLRPDQAEPWEKIAAIQSFLSPSQMDSIRDGLAFFEKNRSAREFYSGLVQFEKGIQLDGIRVRSKEIRRGESIGLNFYWSFQKKYPAWAQTAVWVHFENEQGNVVFQGDHELIADLSHKKDISEIEPRFYEIPVPATVPPGAYSIYVGLHLPESHKRLKIASSDWSHTQKSVKLPWNIVVKE